MLNTVANTPLGAEWKKQDTSIFNIEALFFNCFKYALNFSKNYPIVSKVQ